MKTDNENATVPTQDSTPKQVAPKGTNKQDKMPRKKKKKHSSALAAVALGRSAVNHARASAYRDTDYMNTGTNLSYRDEA